ncbi:MAG: M20/M25/M40 family metallo-hydrolase [Verrucomicrobiae bacterium]|nr:M20/M25/M40 family metallo-hydrolase [Verrucomicrobiae bacterium]
MNPTDPILLLRELVALPSVNPSLLPPGSPADGERQVADFLTAVAAAGGLEVERQEAAPGRFNLWLRLAPSGPVRRRVWLAPHLDTVPPADPAQLRPVVRNGRLYGRGACDTKGSVAAMLAALLDIARHGPRPAGVEMVLLALVDEEYHQAGSRAAAASGRRADLAIIGEPTACRVVTAHKGNAWLQITTRGRAAHGSTPEKGRNAVEAMGRVIQVLSTTGQNCLRRRCHSLLGHPTLSLGRIEGGTQPNIVPDHCTLTLDRRLLPGETAATAAREMQEWLRRAGLRGVTVANLKPVPCPALCTPASLPLVRQLMQAARCARPTGAPFFCDAAILAAAGTPAVVFGPGHVAQAHTVDEYVSLAQVRQATAVLRRFLSSLAP